MKLDLLLKILSSLPIILITLYFFPFLGICLILLRYFIYPRRKRVSTLILVIIFGILIFLPKLLYIVLDMVNFDLNQISYLNDIVNSDLYNTDFINYGKMLIYIGVILSIISLALNKVFYKISNKLNSIVFQYISETQKKETKISKQNDLEIKIKQEKAKNTSYVKCPYCGSDNLLSEKFGICKFCRRKIENKNYQVKI